MCIGFRIRLIFVAVMVFWAIYPESTMAGEGEILDGVPSYDQGGSAAGSRSGEDFSSIAREIMDGFDFTFRTLGYGTGASPSNSDVNPGNVLQIPNYTLNLDLRPDFFLDFRRLNLMFKPRLNVRWRYWEEGPKAGDSGTNDDWFVNEWLVRLMLMDGLFASYGRENLQWGPSWMVSPSNPFFRDNGQANPKAEVRGMDFGRLIWTATPSWTASLIANTGKGLQEFLGEFESTYALKLDYTSFKKYASLIVSHREEESLRVGGFAGWTVSDAFLLYGEGSMFKGRYYFEPNQDFPAQLEVSDDWTKNDDSLEGILLVGGSYTFEIGSTMTLEYVYNSPGFNDQEAQQFFDLANKASDRYDKEPIKYDSLFNSLDDPPSYNIKLFRKNYIMLQYIHAQIRDVLNVIFRYTYNIDDGSSQLLPIVEYYVGDHAQLFLIGSQAFGSENSEFKALVDRSFMLGIEYTF